MTIAKLLLDLGMPGVLSFLVFLAAYTFLRPTTTPGTMLLFVILFPPCFFLFKFVISQMKKRISKKRKSSGV